MGESTNKAQWLKSLTIDRYEHGLIVRALYELWKRALAEEDPTEDIEGLLLKVIDAPAKNDFGGLNDERTDLPP